MEDVYRILVPTDFSETADHALDIGIRLAKRANAQLHLFHIADFPKDWVAMVEHSDNKLYLNMKKQLDEIKEQVEDRLILARNKGANVESFLEFNKGYKTILGHAENYQTDLIVMGAHGRSGLRGMLIGSFTQRVLHHSGTPVLAMKKTDKVSNLKKMVFVSDYSPIYANSFRATVEFAQKMGIKLHMLFLNTKANFRESDDIDIRMNEYLKKAPADIIESVDVINSIFFEDGLIKYCEDEQIDLVSMTIHSKNHSWGVLGSTGERLVNQLNIPVLGVPARQ